MNIKVLFADDNVIITKTFTRTLTKAVQEIRSDATLEVVCADNGQEAFEKFQHDLEFDIVVLDHQMPVKGKDLIQNGLEAADAIRKTAIEKDKSVQIWGFSDFYFTLKEKDPKKISSFDELLQKPVSMKNLKEVFNDYFVKSVSKLSLKPSRWS